VQLKLINKEECNNKRRETRPRGKREICAPGGERVELVSQGRAGTFKGDPERKNLVKGKGQRELPARCPLLGVRGRPQAIVSGRNVDGNLPGWRRQS